ncbi:response regulator transcription factor [Changpingibacter yushuensis]|uniref:response regulator transcription factor n=1 Tax=Changpingibacter yushuensis TaxID=2758440 RepID=UPI00165EAEC8|nr:response regulator transcription factor [Changpingibacter yushuensis]
MQESDSGAIRKALVVDDEADLAKLVAAYLERDGFTVNVSGDGMEALTIAKQTDPDLVVLDLGLPGMDGMEVCREIRAFSDCYVLMLTARTDEAATLAGLGVGADDYMTKPFSPREVVARTRVLFRRPRTSAALSKRLVFGGMEIDLARRSVHLAGQEIDLTKTEFDVLAFLVGAPEQAHSRESILAGIWGESWVGDPRAIDVHVTHIRAKIGPDGPDYVETVRGVGYRLGDGRTEDGRPEGGQFGSPETSAVQNPAGGQQVGES